MKRRILTIALAFIMCLALLPTTALADNDETRAYFIAPEDGTYTFSYMILHFEDRSKDTKVFLDTEYVLQEGEPIVINAAEEIPYVEWFFDDEDGNVFTEDCTDYARHSLSAYLEGEQIYVWPLTLSNAPHIVSCELPIEPLAGFNIALWVEHGDVGPMSSGLYYKSGRVTVTVPNPTTYDYITVSFAYPEKYEQLQFTIPLERISGQYAIDGFMQYYYTENWSDRTETNLGEVLVTEYTWGQYVQKWNDANPNTPSSWAVEEVSAAISAGLVPENLQKNYTKPVSRGDVAQMVINLIEKTTGQSIDTFLATEGVSINPNAFTDTSDKAVLAANALGIIYGVGNNKFEPDSTFTRAQIATIINRIGNVLGFHTDGYTHKFADLTGHWADSELGWPVHTSIINGVSNGRFEPDGQLTTEQAIAIAYRAMQHLTGQGQELIIGQYLDTTGVSQWAAEYIEKSATEREVFYGTTPGSDYFYPEDAITRALFIEALVQMADEEVPGSVNYGDMPFTDVDIFHRTAPYIKWAYDNEIVLGTTPTTFKPDAPISRQDVATILGRYFEHKGIYLPIIIDNPTPFIDVDTISDYALDYVIALQKVQVIEGHPDGRFSPRGLTLRGEAAKMIYMLYKNDVIG